MLFSRRHPVRDDELNAYIDGRLAAAPRARIDAHLGACEVCRETVASLRSLRSALGALPLAERRRSFVLRAADVSTRAGLRPSGGYPLAAQLLSAVTVMAVLVFVSLVGLDASGGRSRELAGSSAQFESDQGLTVPLESAARDSAGAAGTPGDQYFGEQPPSQPATGPLPETPATEGEQPPAGEDMTAEANAAVQATPPSVAGAAGETPAEALVSTPPATGGESALTDAPPEAPGPSTPDEKSAQLEQSGEGGSDTGLRAGEAAAAAIALLAGGSLAFVWWRRRAL